MGPDPGLDLEFREGSGQFEKSEPDPFLHSLKGSFFHTVTWSCFEFVGKAIIQFLQ
jgi:hypothetical protein